MPSVVDSLNLISETMEDILNFVASDEMLSNDFQQYLEINNIEIETEKDFNNVIIQYMLDMKINTAKKLLEESSMSINEISEVLNFDTPAYFCRFFKNKTKFYPGEFRRLSKQ
jgi:AraC-like DNA-binding protein